MAGLHPEMRAILDEMASNPSPPLSSLSPAAARALDAQGFDAVWNADAPAVAAVRDIRLGGIPIRIYDPGVAAPAPCLVYFHGGGFVLGGLGSHDKVCRELAIAGGILVAAIDYRLSPEHKFPLPLEDCIAATRSLVTEGKALGIDPACLAVGGDSAGGNLALSTLLSLRDEDSTKPKAGLLVYGMFAANPATDSQRRFGDGSYLLSTADTEWFWECYLNSAEERRDWRAVPLHADLRGLPPLCIAAAEFDPLLDDSLLLVQRLKSAGQPYEVHLWEGLVHAAFQMSRRLSPMRAHIADIGRWLAARIGSADERPSPGPA